jgi:hypothetical protein
MPNVIKGVAVPNHDFVEECFEREFFRLKPFMA